MVKIIANIPPATYKRIIEQVEDGEYSDVSQFIIAACENQLTLAFDEDGGLGIKATTLPVLGTIPMTVETEKKKSTEKKVKRQDKKRTKSSQYTKTHREKIELSPDEIRSALEFFKLSSTENLPELLPPMEEYTKEWPWGQANRYLPMKMVVRAIANAAQTGEWPLIADITESLKQPSAILGSVLEGLDRKAGRKREKQLTTALPKLNSEKGEKSQQRFVNTFLCNLSPTGIFYPGGSFFYGLTGLLNDERIGLTVEGIAFCNIPNPVLCGVLDQAETAINTEEIAWLRKHVETLPGEYKAFSTVIDTIDKQELTPDEFVNRMAINIGKDPKSGSFRIQFNGVIGRMIELNYIERKWKGTRAFYQMSIA